jgi:thioredoxin reductase (NADPH)
LEIREGGINSMDDKSTVPPDKWDIIILGGGPAGLTAGLYAARGGMKSLLLEKEVSGGQAATTDWVDNYPGFHEGISGLELSKRMEDHAVRFGLEILDAEVRELEILEGDHPSFKVTTNRGTFEGLSIILSPGAHWNQLGVPGEEEFRGRGVSYCATCDGPFFQDQEVVVVGGGDTAVEEGTYLTKIAKKVTIVHRRDRLRATAVIQKRAFDNPKIDFIWNAVVEAIEGGMGVERLRLRDVKSDASIEKPCDGVFIFIGMVPNTQFLKGIVEMDDRGYILSDEDMQTSVEGIFACGDARKKLLRQIVTACGEGATAAFAAQHYVERLKGTAYE